VLILAWFLITSVALSGAPAQVSAQTPDIYYEEAELTYTINVDRSVDVQRSFTLVNNSPSSIQSMTRTVPSNNIENISVHDDVGAPLHYENTTIGGQRAIKVYFDGRMGPGDQLTYFEEFSAWGLVSGSGAEYTCQFGRLHLGADNYPYNEYVVNVQGPPGTQLFLYEPTNATLNGENIHYETQLDPPVDFDGVRGMWYTSLTYYGVNIERTISNPGPDTTTSLQLDVILFNNEDNWQFSSLVESSPSPKAVYVDEENNWHGVFEIGAISPGETKTLELNLVYQASVHDPGITAANVGELTDVPARLEKYLESLQYWESDSQVIQNVASTVVAGETNVYLAAEKIVDFVDNHLEHHSQTTRHGALQAYQNPTDADCSEYTDLSIALARAVGIPARASYGWGYGENGSVGHAWLEFYFPGVGWQPVDPTWADASGDYFGRLDPIHIQRSLRGLESTEGYVTYTYKGNKPSISESSENILVLTKAEAVDDFLSAAEVAIDLASNLLEGGDGGENLNQELGLAQSLLEQAKNVSDTDQKLVLSQLAIQHANVVIQELGEPPAGGAPFINLQDLLVITIVIVALIALSGGIWHAVRKRRERSSTSS
jgi:transglutaminase-like putative cysteine protease